MFLCGEQLNSSGYREEVQLLFLLRQAQYFEEVSLKLLRGIQVPFEDVVHLHGDDGLHVLIELGAFPNSLESDEV